MKSFYCEICNQTFEAAGNKQEVSDPIFGSMWFYTATCSTCGNKAKELKTALKSSPKRDETVQTQGCATGTCPFVN
jgi:C4-type Zn-finger protein